MNHTVRIQGSLTAITPFHMAHASLAGHIEKDTGEAKVLRTGTATIPCVMTYKVPVRVQKEEGTQRALIPTIPATSLRGRIRRAAADRMKKHWVETNQSLDRQSYQVLQVLSFGGQKIDKAKGVKPEDITRASQDLYAGVFGGGPQLFPSKLVTVDSLAITAETVALGILGAEAEQIGAAGAPPAWQTTFGHPYVCRDDLLLFTDPLAPRVIADFDKTFAD